VNTFLFLTLAQLQRPWTAPCSAVLCPFRRREEPNSPHGEELYLGQGAVGEDKTIFTE
jgi:hypothetical protein